MGQLLYGSPPTAIDIDDRTLAHLQIAILAKMRRSEAFLLSLPADVSRGSGRRALWMHDAIPLRFAYSGSGTPSVDPARIELLTRAANSAQGLAPLAERAPDTAQSGRPA